MAGLVRAVAEFVLLTLVVISPWPFASVDPLAESALTAGVLLITALWLLHASLTGRLTLRGGLVTWSLVGLIAWSAVRLVPLPEAIVGFLSPVRLQWHHAFLPELSEVLPGETGPTPRSSRLPLTIDPSGTRTWLARVSAILLVFLAARNWLATPHSFRRLCWALTVTGVCLAAVALSQAASSPPNVVYWRFHVPGAAFGPFICRNHYPDFVALCLGGCVGLLLTRSRRASAGGLDYAVGEPPLLLTGRGLGLAASAGLMAASIPFSLSRGGMLATVAAAAGAWMLAHSGGSLVPGRRSALAGAAAVAVGTALWFGVGQIEDRLDTLAGPDAALTRTSVWRDCARLTPRFWAAGTGDGTFEWAEATARTKPVPRDGADVLENAHNEYLEAAVEGGVPRLVLTLALGGGLVAGVARGYRRRHDRPSGPLILGAWLGLSAVVAHAAVDFGIHMPAVALATAVVAGYATAAANDHGFGARRRRLAGRSPHGGHDRPSSGEPHRPVESHHPAPLTGFGAAAAGVLLAGLAGFAALEARSRDDSSRLKAAADLAYWDGGNPDRLARRAALLDARAAARPDDPKVLMEAAQGHIDAAVAVAAVAGVDSPNRFPPAAVESHLAPALRLLRAARDANPIAPKPHTRLALYGEYFAVTEPPATHFARAKQLAATDPELWYASGRSALRRGELEAAWSDWRQSLALSDRRLPDILAEARARLTPAEVCDRLIPDDPALLLDTADRLFPDPAAGGVDRKRFLTRAAEAGDRVGTTPAGLAAAALARSELGDEAGAAAAWARALALAPEDEPVRDKYGRWLVREELYEEAIPHLEWLRARRPSDAGVRDQLDIARHGVKLKRGIGGK